MRRDTAVLFLPPSPISSIRRVQLPFFNCATSLAMRRPNRFTRRRGGPTPSRPSVSSFASSALSLPSPSLTSSSSSSSSSTPSFTSSSSDPPFSSPFLLSPSSSQSSSSSISPPAFPSGSSLSLGRNFNSFVPSAGSVLHLRHLLLGVSSSPPSSRCPSVYTGGRFVAASLASITSSPLTTLSGSKRRNANQPLKDAGGREGRVDAVH